MICPNPNCREKMKCVESRPHRISGDRLLCDGVQFERERRYICLKCGTKTYSQEFMARSLPSSTSMEQITDNTDEMTGIS